MSAPDSKHRARVTPAKRRASMTCAQRLKGVFGVDIATSAVRRGAVRIVACIEDAEVIEKILNDRDAKVVEPKFRRLPHCWTPLQASLSD